jgi:hypothetical protein
MAKKQSKKGKPKEKPVSFTQKDFLNVMDNIVNNGNYGKECNKIRT